MSRTALSNESGLYPVPLLNAGRYRIDVVASGFSPASRPDLRLEVGQTARLDFELKVGAVSESVTVSASATNPIEPEEVMRVVQGLISS